MTTEPRLSSLTLTPVDFDPFRQEQSAPTTLPMTEAQREIWLATQMGEDGSRAFADAVAVHLRGPCQVSALREAIQQLVARHDALRSRFSADGKECILEAFMPVDVPLDDLSARPPAQREGLLDELARQDVWDPFDLGRGPVLRARIARLGEEHHVLLVSVHHIAVDGWSLGILLEEIGTLYSAVRQGRTAPLGPARQFADYAREERELEGTAARTATEQYWLEQFAAPVPVLELPADRPRPAVKTYRAGRERLTLPAALGRALRHLGASRGSTLFTALLAGLKVVLHRLTGHEDIVVGIVVAGQTAEGANDVVGHCASLLPVRSRLEPDMPFADYLSSLKTIVFDVHDHRRYTYGSLLEKLRLPRDRSRLPLTSVIFNLDPPAVAPKFAGLEAELVIPPRRAINFDVDVNIAQSAGNLVVDWYYNIDLFESDTIRQWLRSYQAVLEGLAADPQQNIGFVSVLSAEDRGQILGRWNATERDYPATTVPLLFDAQAGRTPEAVAVVCGGETVTYQQLNHRANRLAHRLRELGVGPDVLVGLCLERSADLVVALLAVLKAGGAYVPLDPTFPTERLGFMLEDSQAVVLLTRTSLRDRVPAGTTTVVYVDSDCAELSDRSAGPPSGPIDPESLAYAIYTSGSTGRPKGVEIPHRAVANFLGAMQEILTLTPSDQMLSVTTISFDIAVLELILPLVVGAKVEVVSQDAAADGRQLAQWITRSGTTVMQATPATWRLLLEAGWEGRRPFKALCGGEALARGLAAELLSRASEVWNLYGPTETTIWSTAHRVTPGDGAVSIGRPLANTRVYVLDPRGQPRPVGVPGELYIGGAGVARGYRGRPDLSAERFVADPFAGRPGARLYRTGDLVRYRSDGQLDFLGRLDHQVKIRGFRIELGEIETVLGQHPLVGHAVVVVRESHSGDQRLVAYVVGRGGAEPSAADLRAYLGQKLPHYMIPSVFVPLPTLPLTPSGKVDRSALPDAIADGAPVPRLAPPTTATERFIAQIWCDLLDLPEVGVHDNFFDLGGHSLLGMRMVARLRDSFGADVSLRALFESPSVAQLATLIDAGRAAFGRPSDLAPRAENGAIPRRLDTGPCPLSFAQQRLWFLNQLTPDSPLHNIASAVRLGGALDLPALQQSLDLLVARHEALRTTFAFQRGSPVQIIAGSRPADVTVVDLRAWPAAPRETELGRLLRQEAGRPFDLTRDLLLRAAVVRLAADECVLLLVSHHIASDGWSLGVLFQELAALYEAFTHGRPSPLPALPIQYADFALWQRQMLEGPAVTAQRAYWIQQLAGVPPLLELPTDRPRPAVQSYRGAHHYFALPAALTADLLALSRREDVTLFMCLLAAVQTLVHRLSGQSDIVVASPIAGRSRPDLEPLIGVFVNTLALRTSAADDPSFRDLLGRVRRVTLDAYDHQDLPFEKLVEDLRPERSLGHAPLAQVMFVLENTAPIALALPGLTARPIDTETGASEFDLTLFLRESSEGLRGALQYNTDLFDPPTIARLAGHFRVLLEGIVASPTERLSALPLLTDDERRQLLVDWNATGAAHPQQATLPDLLEAQAECSPDAIAAVFEDAALTYRELHRRANQLSHHLRGRGVGPNCRVGLCVERSLDMLVGVLGILKAGGAYVPLDPTYPPERLAFMLADAQAPILVTQRALEDTLDNHDAQTVYLDADWDLISLEPEAPPVSGVTADDVAYVIYTSGSSGQPKGVQVPHRALVNFLASMLRTPGVTAHDCLLAVTTLSFDIAGLELFLPLLVGARVIIARRDTTSDGAQLVGLLARHQVTIMQATPATWRLMLEASWPGTPGLAILCGGEALSTDLATALCRRGVSVWNLYGPTETTIWSTLHRVSGTDDPVPIGRPIANTEIYLLDPHLQPVPVGVPGELHIGGCGLAHGYLHLPDLTAQKFIRHPFSADPNARLYKTGDLARYRADGTLDYLGRLDHQVKLRGFRIELGEVENALARCPGVRESVVVLREDAPELKRLLAYVTSAVAGADLSETELRVHLRRRLPEYMIPSAFVVLDALPLAPNGKVDRRALPARDESGRADRPTASPRSDTEKALAAIWADVLQQDRVDIHDNFFDLGGHSLLAARLIARAREQFAVELPLRSLFIAPTVAGLAEVVDTLTWASGKEHSAPIGARDEIEL